MSWFTWPDQTVDAVVTHTLLNGISTDLKQTMPGIATSTGTGSWYTATTLNTIAERKPDSAVITTTTGISSTTFTTFPAGPTITAETGAQALVMWMVNMQVPTAGETCYVTYQCTGATTITAASEAALEWTGSTDATFRRAGSFDLVTGLSSTGTNTFTMLARSSTSGTTVTVSNKELVVIPF